jgi:uncharacterized tellurite resistance protein B-like protein
MLMIDPSDNEESRKRRHMTTEDRRLFCRIVCMLVASDLQVHPREVQYLEDLYGRLGVQKRERLLIEASINLNDDVSELAQQLSWDARCQLLGELHAAAWVDGVLAPSEVRIIETIQEVLKQTPIDSSD